MFSHCKIERICQLGFVCLFKVYNFSFINVVPNVLQPKKNCVKVIFVNLNCSGNGWSVSVF